MSGRMISYAMNFEDVLLRRAFPSGSEGFYIDAGAFDPVEYSVTKHFYDRGWRGINIEPDLAAFARLRADRPRDINLNLGVSDREGRLTFFEAAGAHWSADRSILTGYFGIDPGKIHERMTPVTTLARICEDHVPPGLTIDFLKIDVEGLEREVIEGANWGRWRPRVVLAESNRPESWEPRLLASGYLFAAFDGVNRYYVRSEDACLLPAFQTPVNVCDDFLIYSYLKIINELREKLGTAQELGPVALDVARRLRALSVRYPRLARAGKRLLRQLA
jgi:FkbM family methyltransferase